MRRAIVPLTTVLALQLLLALLLVMRHDPLAAKTGDTPLIVATAIKDADRLVIEGKPAAGAAVDSASVTFARKDGTWVLPTAFDAPADGARLNGLLDRLGALKRGLPIATSEAALRRFKVVDADFERKLVLSAGDKTLDTIYLGSSPGLRKSDARASTDRAVYAVDLPIYELPTDLAAWLSPDLLRADTDHLAALEVTNGSDKTQLQKQTAAATSSGAQPAPSATGAGVWVDPALPATEHLDTARVEALAQDIQQLRAEAVLGTTGKPEWQQEHPAVTLKLQDDKAHAVDWTLSKPSSGDYYVLKSSAHPWYFSVSSTLGKQLVDGSARGALIVSDKPTAKPAGKS
jgi:uncharacterized protein DUF4340